MASPDSVFNAASEWCLALQQFLPILAATFASLTDATVQIGKNVLAMVGAWTLLRPALARLRKPRRGS